MGTLRPTIRLVSEAPKLRVMRADGADGTELLTHHVIHSVESLKSSDMRGFILKSHSPSCGMERVRGYTKGHPTRHGRGIFAQHLISALLQRPVEDEGRLNEPRLRENFTMRVFTYHR